MSKKDKFLKDICKTVGHDYAKSLACQRCGKRRPLDEIFTSPAALKKIASAMASPLKSSLDYRGLPLLKVDKIEQGDLPVYDSDLPPRKPTPKKRAKRSS